MTTERRLPVVGDVLRFWRTVNGGERGGILGHARLYSRGWKFTPNVSGRKPSRKFHRTLAACLPRWVGYPDGCESEYLPDKPRPLTYEEQLRAKALNPMW